MILLLLVVVPGTLSGDLSFFSLFTLVDFYAFFLIVYTLFSSTANDELLFPS